MLAPEILPVDVTLPPKVDPFVTTNVLVDVLPLVVTLPPIVAPLVKASVLALILFTTVRFVRLPNVVIEFIAVSDKVPLNVPPVITPGTYKFAIVPLPVVVKLPPIVAPAVVAKV